VANDSSAESPSGYVQSIPSEPITLILGGYSYGSLIVTQLPPTTEILAIFCKPSKWTSDILLRARELALETNTSASHQREFRGRLPNTPSRRQHKRQSSSQHSIIYGGNDSPSPADRHNIDPIHNGVDIQTRIKHAMHRTHKSSSSTKSTTSSNISKDSTEPMPALPHISPHYLLISPLLPPLSNFLSFSPTAFFSWGHHDHQPPTLVHHPTLVVYGTKDMFTSSSKLDTWCKKMDTLSTQNKGLSSFRWRKVDGAGHFWREKGVEAELRFSVREWVGEVVSQEEKS
jgi:alpha/beta superfamily hydrolase